ncbi:hypothetical protein D3Z53_06280 [Lachnospiraceae bacterium]|nr:hypothetical protein [Lachnospiraceae bacterium]
MFYNTEKSIFCQNVKRILLYTHSLRNFFYAEQKNRRLPGQTEYSADARQLRLFFYERSENISNCAVARIFANC